MRPHDHPFFHDPAMAAGPPLTDALVAQAEAVLGLRLPQAYLDLLRLCNGGELRKGWIGTAFPTRTGTSSLVLRDLLGIGGIDGIEQPGGSLDLIEEWDLPSPGVVLSSEGPQAVMLDYRSCGPRGEPRVVYVDGDEEGCWTVAPTMADFVARLEHRRGRSMVAVPGRASLEEMVARCEAMGAVGPPRVDYLGGHSLSLLGLDSTEHGPTLLTIRPNRRVDAGALVIPELPDCQWLLETTVVTAEVPALLARMDAVLPEEGIVIHARVD